MTTVTIPVTAYSAQSAFPDKPYGQLATLPVLNGSRDIYLRAPLSKIPDGATVVSAKIQFTGRSDETGSYTARVQPLGTPPTWNSNITWSTRPTTVVGTAVAVTKSSPTAGTLWEWTVSTDTQSVVSGTRVDYGWRLIADVANATSMNFAGSTAETGQPVLVVEYTVVPDEPENLHPSGGAVSIAKPVLTFDGDDDMTALQVQIDAAMDAGSPDFASGTVASSGGLLDLAATAYAGLSSGSSTYWRARQQTAGGWSPWSDWVPFSRVSWAAASLVNPPSGAIEDPTPPVEWTFAGTQTAYRARILKANGTLLATSGYTPGTGTTWTPDKGFTRSGQTGELQVDIYDNQDRVATPGDPEYKRLTLALTYTLDASVDPVNTLNAAMAPDGLGVLLTGIRTLGTPDKVAVFRDGDLIATHVGTDVFTGTAYSITDPLPPLGIPVTYRVAPIVGGSTASGGPTATLTPAAIGIHLFDTEDPDDRVLLLTETGAPEQDEPEDAIVHRPLNTDDDGLGQVVRRRLVRFRKEGVVNGVLVDDPDGEELLREWATFDAGHSFSLAFAGYSGTVIVGNFVFTERDNPRQAHSREVGVKFSYWGQA